MSKLTPITDDGFKKLICEKAKFAVLFSADWCKPCLALKLSLEAIDQEMAGNPRIYVYDCDSNNEVAGESRVIAIPTLILFDGTKSNIEQDRLVGINSAKKIKECLDKIKS